MSAILDMVSRHRAGQPIGVPSVCSAHPLVIRAALAHALSVGRIALIEATSNQVNQEGGYTGLVPAQFRDLVGTLADEVGLPRGRLLLGGDHLGPNCWQSSPAQHALERAAAMIEEYARAGFHKLHLDCSMACADDPPALSEALIAERTAILCERAEQAARGCDGEMPVYVIGSEVPVPGGARETLTGVEVTKPEAALATVEAHREAFLRRGLQGAWERVIGLVVQPGVEFDDATVIDYVPEKARALSTCLDSLRHLVFEAHSTDYQKPAALDALVRDHFAILKVGPALTFALREAVWALDAIEGEWLGAEHRSGVRKTLLAAMREDPRHWMRYYHREGHELELQLEYSLSDRIRYYWPAAPVQAALRRLCASFERAPPPLALLRQYLPDAYAAVRAGTLRPRAERLIMHHISQVLGDYTAACH